MELSEDWRRLVRRRPWSKRFALSLCILFIIMYAPYSWLLLIDYPWSDYHWHWVRMWLGLPGLIPFHSVESETTQLAGAHLLSVAVLVVASLASARGWKWLISIAVVLALLSTWNAIGLYHAFLA